MPSSPLGRIYFAEANGTGMIKIGYARRVLKRLLELTTGCPVRLNLLAVIEGASIKDEQRLHRQFRLLRKQGEWFRDHPDLRALMAQHALPQTIHFTGSEIEPPCYRAHLEDDDLRNAATLRLAMYGRPPQPLYEPLQFPACSNQM